MRRLLFLCVSSGFAFVTLLSAMPAAGMSAAGAADATTVKIVEPPLKPPQTWGYQPATLQVKVGTTVTWINDGTVVHTVTASDRKAFDSKNILVKGSFSWTFRSPGTFVYFCTYHPWMKGRIVVEP